MKTNQLFERLWEHGRTLRRVGLVLVMCLITITQAYAYKITGGHTIYFDNSIAEWTGPQMQVKQNDSNKPVYEFTQIGTTSFYYKVFSTDWDGYDGIYYFNWTGSNWGNKSTYERYDINSDVVIVAKSSSDNTAIGKFTTFQKAYPSNRIYFDATGATGWGDKAYFRYGFDCVAHADPMTKFPGTASLFYIDVNEAYFIKYTIANNAGWTKANTVYQPSSGCKPTGDYAITHSLNFSQSDINGGDSKITTCVITTPKSSTADGCDWYNYTKTGNASIPTQTVNVGSVSNGKIRVEYYNTSGEETYWEGSGGTSLTVPQSAIITVKAIPNTGYYNSALTVGGGAFTSGSTYTVTATTAIAATFARSYAFIEGRFRVYNAARNTRTSVGGQGSWVKNSTNIPMSFDGTNGRFELHTYSTPAELKAAFTGGEGDADPYFYIKTSTASNSISSGNDDGPAEYWATSTSSNGNKLLNAGTANKRAVSKTSDALTFVGNSSSNDEYVILYCDGSYVWYELEYTLEYSAGTGSGTAPASKTYYNKNSKATVASNTFTAPSGYHFHHWSGSDGKTYAASDKVTMNSNVTLTAIWALDYPTGYIYITDVMATPATKAGTTITATITSATYKSTLSSTFNTNRVGYEEWAQTTGSGNYNLAFSSALDLSSYTGGVDIDVWWGANDKNRATRIKINGGTAQDLDAVSDSKDRNQVRKATYHTDVTSLSSLQVLGPSSSGTNVVWFRVGIKETPTYALTYDDNTDAEVSNMPTSPVNKPAGTITLASEEPTRSGYAFQGWTEDALNAGTVYAAGGSYTMPASAQTLYAKWAQTYTLTYDDGDGSGAPSAEEHVPGSITLSSTEPTRSGYVFLGWTVHGGDGTLYAAGGSYTMPSSDVTLDAEWEEICFQATITKTSQSYSVDGNSTKNITSDATITSGGSVICVNNNASSKSFSFYTDGVSPGTSDGYVEFVFPTGTILQTGTVIRVQGAADDASRGLLLIDDSGTTLASQTNNGAIKFSYEVTALSTINGNDHIRIKRANTSGKNAVKTIIITDCGTVSCTTSPTVTAASNSAVAVTTATVTCASGISSLGSAGCEISSYGFVLGTSSNPTTSNTTYEVGTTYTSTGVSFYKDLTSLVAGTTYYVRPYATNANGTAYGTQTSFTMKYAITTGSYTNGSVTIPSSAASGATVNISATGDTGYDFTSWTIINTSTEADVTATLLGDNSETASTSFTMPSYGVTVNATFTAIDYAITHSAASNGSYTIQVASEDAVSTNTTANYGQTITLAATPSSHYKLQAWNVTCGGDPVAVTNNQFSMPAGNVTIAPTFGEVYTVTFNSNGGSSVDAIEQSTVGGAITMPDAPTKDDYTFVNWMIGGTTKDAGDSYTPTANVTAYATWKSDDCAGGGGSTTLFSASHTSSTTMSASTGTVSLSGTSSESANNGIKFSSDAGYISATGTSDFEAGDVITVRVYNSNSNSKTVGFKLKSTNHDSPSAVSSEGTCDIEYTLLAADIEDDGTLKVYRSSSNSGSVRIQSVVVVRGSGSSCYTVTYHGNGATSGYTNDPAQHTAGSDVTVMYNDPTTGFKRTGYEFNGWNTKADASGTRYDYWDIDHRTIEDIAADVDLYAEWRIVINADNTDFAGKDSPTQYKDVKVTNGATLTITNATTIRDIIVTDDATLKLRKNTTAHDVTVETGSTLNINTTNGDGTGDGITLTANSLSLQGGFNELKSKYDMPRVYINPKCTLTRTDPTINFDISVNHRNYYPIALPFDVALDDVDYADSYLASISTYGMHYEIDKYNGQKRANSGGGAGNWETVTSGETLKAGKGYIMSAITDGGKAIIRFPMNVPNGWTTAGEQGTYDAVTKNEVAVYAYTKAEGETKKANKGWNLLGVPYMSCFVSSEMDADPSDAYIKGLLNIWSGEYKDGDNNIYVTIPKYDFTEYDQLNITEAVLLPGWCFFVQMDKDATITFDKAGERARAPFRATTNNQAKPTVKIGIILSGAEASDKTTILVSDKYNAAEYEINADLEKMFGENGYTLATYSLSGETRLAYNAMSNADAENIIPIGYRAPADGEYTFSINPRYAEDNVFESVNLIDYETGIVTDLLMSSYTFSTDRTQNDARFALNVVKQKETPTGIENGANGANDANGVRKLLLDGKMYIILDGKMFDAQGKRVK